MERGWTMANVDFAERSGLRPDDYCYKRVTTSGTPSPACVIRICDHVHVHIDIPIGQNRFEARCPVPNIMIEQHHEASALVQILPDFCMSS